jgi:aminomethyltransferase
MVPFAGWSMPIQYKDSIMEATEWCRTKCSVFDVSHMCGLTLRGKDAVPFLEGLVTGDIAGLADNTGSLSVLTNEQGGIIDDTVVTKVSPTEVYMVVNAGCREKDLAHLEKHLSAAKAAGKDVSMEVHDDRSLLAVQGPKAAEVLGALGVKKDGTAFDLSKFYFGNFARVEVGGGLECWVTRTGYTGEDGFEVSVPNAQALELAQKLVSKPDLVRFAGLGPRDSLRLEAGLCLYGNDLNEQVTPVEAGLAWTVGKRRREAFDFLGGSVIKRQLADGVSQRRVGLVCEGPPARQHSDVTDEAGNKIGEVSSGAFSPCLKKNIGMGYVDKAFAKAGTKVKVVVRGKSSDATVTKMPFVPTTYFKG